MRRRWKGFSSSGIESHDSERGWSRGQLCIRRYPAHLFGALVSPFAVFVPAIVELALIFIGPFFRHVKGPCEAPLAQYMKNGLSGLNAFC